jgi:hypothetical protein
MEPRREEQKPEEPRPEVKRKRFRLIKLEERIAPREYGDHGYTKGLACTKGGHGGGSFDCSGGLSIE